MRPFGIRPSPCPGRNRGGPALPPEGVGSEAREAAERAERSIDRATREGRKYGLSLLFIGQSSKDFSHTLAVSRQNVTTRLFLNNSDREVQYAADYLSDAKAIVSLPPGEAFVCNAEWGVVRVSVRLPLSKVWEPDDKSVRRLLDNMGPRPRPPLSNAAQAVLEMAREQCDLEIRPVRLSRVLERLGITSRRKIQQIVAELERSHSARFERLPERGEPLVIVPANDRPARRNCGQERTETRREENP